MYMDAMGKTDWELVLSAQLVIGLLRGSSQWLLYSTMED